MGSPAMKYSHRPSCPPVAPPSGVARQLLLHLRVPSHGAAWGPWRREVQLMRLRRRGLRAPTEKAERRPAPNPTCSVSETPSTGAKLFSVASTWLQHCAAQSARRQASAKPQVEISARSRLDLGVDLGYAVDKLSRLSREAPGLRRARVAASSERGDLRRRCHRRCYRQRRARPPAEHNARSGALQSRGAMTLGAR